MFFRQVILLDTPTLADAIKHAGTLLDSVTINNKTKRKNKNQHDNVLTIIDMTRDFNQNKWLGQELTHTLIFFDDKSKPNGLLAVLGCVKAPYSIILACHHVDIHDYFKREILLPQLANIAQETREVYKAHEADKTCETGKTHVSRETYGTTQTMFHVKPSGGDNVTKIAKDNAVDKFHVKHPSSAQNAQSYRQACAAEMTSAKYQLLHTQGIIHLIGERGSGKSTLLGEVINDVISDDDVNRHSAFSPIVPRRIVLRYRNMFTNTDAPYTQKFIMQRYSHINHYVDNQNQAIPTDVSLFRYVNKLIEKSTSTKEARATHQPVDNFGDNFGTNKIRIVLSSPSPAASKNTLRVKALNDVSRETFAYCSPQQFLDAFKKAHWGIIDEAATFPKAILKEAIAHAQKHHKKLILSTTIEGYEGTGQSYRLNFLHNVIPIPKNNLSRQTGEDSTVVTASTSNDDRLFCRFGINASTSMKQTGVGESHDSHTNNPVNDNVNNMGNIGDVVDSAVDNALNNAHKTNTIVTLNIPKRFSMYDPLYLLCRSIYQPSAHIEGSNNAQHAQYTCSVQNGVYILDAKTLRTRGWTSACFALLREAHYKTTPNDLARFYGDNADSEAALFAVHIEEGEVIACAYALPEQLPSDIDALSIFRGTRRAKNSLTHQALLHAYGELALCEDGFNAAFLRSRILRISRIAVARSHRRQGLASQLIQALSDDAKQRGYHFLSTSFSGSEANIAFWLAQHFTPARIGIYPNKYNDEYAVVMLRALSDTASEIVARCHRCFQRHIRYFHHLYLPRYQRLLGKNTMQNATQNTVRNDGEQSDLPWWGRVTPEQLREEIDSVERFHRDINWLLPILDEYGENLGYTFKPAKGRE